MSGDVFVKDPAAELDYGIHLAPRTAGFGGTDWLESGETVSTATCVVVDGDVSIPGDVQISGGKLSQTVTGGTAGTEAELRFRFTTSAGRTDDRSIRILIEEL